MTENRSYNNKLKKLLENNQADYIIGYIISPIGFVPYQITDIYPISHIESSMEIRKDTLVRDELVSTIRNQFNILNPESIIFMKDKRLDQGVIDFIVRELKPEKVIDCESNLVYSELEGILNNQE